MKLLFSFIMFYCHGDHVDRHVLTLSFPTRLSSDLLGERGTADRRPAGRSFSCDGPRLRGIPGGGALVLVEEGGEILRLDRCDLGRRVVSRRHPKRLGQPARTGEQAFELGRASCRERVCQYV